MATLREAVATQVRSGSNTRTSEKIRYARLQRERGLDIGIALFHLTGPALGDPAAV
jgi:hypothetical protein